MTLDKAYGEACELPEQEPVPPVIVSAAPGVTVLKNTVTDNLNTTTVIPWQAAERDDGGLWDEQNPAVLTIP